jgi:hypothetical protein
MSHRMNRMRVAILVFAAGLGATVLGACAAETSDAPTTQSAALSANEPAKSEPGYKGRGPDALFARWDKDGDGKVALGDLPERMRSHLAKADANGDGMITRDELKAAHQAMRAESQKKLDTNGDGVVSDEERAAARARFRAEHFAEADKNHDGALSADEVPARRWEHIKVADANGDGKITAAELDAAFAAGKIRPPDRHHGEGAPDRDEH